MCIAKDLVLEAREAAFGEHVEAEGLHGRLLIDQVIVRQSRLRDRMGKLRILHLFRDAKLALVHNDDQVLANRVTLLDEHLVYAGLVLLEKAGDLHRRIPCHALEVR